MRPAVLVGAALLALAPAAQGGGVIRFIGPGGTSAIVAPASPATPSSRLRAWPPPTASLPLRQARHGRTRLRTDAYAGEILQAASMHRLDPALLRAVIHAESAFDPRAISPKGAQGLMQLMPDTARRFGVRHPFRPADNISGGARYLGWLMKRFGGRLPLVLAAYNAGEGAVERHGGIPPYPETRAYVARVQDLYRQYRRADLLAGDAMPSALPDS